MNTEKQKFEYPEGTLNGDVERLQKAMVALGNSAGIPLEKMADTLNNAITWKGWGSSEK